MTLFKRATVVAFSILLLTSLSVPCRAADGVFKNIFEDAFYGGLVGALAGGALLVFTNKPDDHLDYVYYGAAGGVLAGAGYGIAKSSKSLVSMEDGNVKFAMPTIMPELQKNGANGAAALILKADLIKGSF